LKDNCLIEKEIGNLINLRHPCIAAPIGFVVASGLWELGVVGLYATNFSLGEIMRESGVVDSDSKRKAVAGLVLGLRFGHSLGLIQGY
jgi:hypothetical protein